LRDRTATVPSIGLIASSIVSKKIAAGADAIVYDIKMGSGAFMQTLDDARELAQRIVAITKALGRSCVAYITDMDTPLGAMVGSGLEAYEARGLLRGSLARRGRLLDLALHIADAMLACCGLPQRASEVLESGAAYEKMLAMLQAQGGDIAAIEMLAAHAQQHEILCAQGGTLQAIDTVALGEAARDLTVADGAYAGLELLVERGQMLVPGTPLVRVYGTSYEARRIVRMFTLTDEDVVVRPLIYERVS
jgi:thymidine phosphorylase